MLSDPKFLEAATDAFPALERFHEEFVAARVCLPKTRSCGVQGATGFEDARAVRLTSANAGARVEGAGER